MTESLAARLGTHGLGVLVTLKRDGRPQLSNVTYVYDAGSNQVRVSLTDDRAKTKNLRRDPRASLYADGPGSRSYVVVEGKAELSPVAADPHDATVEALVDYYRTASGEHPDWDDYRRAMIEEGRLMFTMAVEHAYGMPSPS
ncbi:pyridoxamine 5'-phosphate oxidase-related FMN- binding protein [Kribbella flavida DSM 17836]|uniref:Pyridoxamine 5'-phosphate oxidase-related FMN-binding protein n=1 Tax=Kribbella flavida (strain DSM 17836 / JCM 10339 / NBRC 14399) TaxID=479435 RepID=D2PW54_KRIFD|nr:PPOX class F420-dependent oxidoreductase [Kribbella flavida]ADB31506.1 pyridoxamine 5'-phosphate oxidase-related FMN- binding protein [Kribbella flavida DSM 17836]